MSDKKVMIEVDEDAVETLDRFISGGCGGGCGGA